MNYFYNTKKYVPAHGSPAVVWMFQHCRQANTVPYREECGVRAAHCAWDYHLLTPVYRSLATFGESQPSASCPRQHPISL